MNDTGFLKMDNPLMKIGDSVELNLYDKPVAGCILKVYSRPGWQGYVYVLLEDKRRVDVPVSCLRMLNGNI